MSGLEFKSAIELGPVTRYEKAEADVRKLRDALAWALDWIDCEGKPDGFAASTEPENWNEHFDAKALLDSTQPTPNSEDG